MPHPPVTKNAQMSVMTIARQMGHEESIRLISPKVTVMPARYASITFFLDVDLSEMYPPRDLEKKFINAKVEPIIPAIWGERLKVFWKKIGSIDITPSSAPKEAV